MLPYRLTCLGPPELHGPDGDPIRFRTRKHLALLIYLATEPPIPHRRDRVATLLWPHANIDESRHSLATALSLLRGIVGSDAFESRRNTIRLIPGRIVSDLEGINGSEAETLGLEIPGPFLEEFEIPDVPDFDLWMESHNAQLVPKLHDIVARQIEQARRRGDSRRVEALGLRLQRIDDVAEEATRALIEARAMSGDRNGAIRAFDRWGARLHDQLGAEPSIFIEKMADRLRRRSWERPTAPTVAPVQTPSWKERTFIGRGAEFQVCYLAMEKVRQNSPRHVLIRGESGIGKTTLVERFATTIALEGASVARVQCYELEQELPFGMMVGLVNHLVDLPGASATAPEQLAELGQLVSKVRQKYPSLPAPRQTNVGESARLLFTEGVMALIAAIADEQPVILVVDDIHLADATSLAVLHLILRRVEDLPLMVVLTSSSTLETETPSAKRFVESADSIGMSQIDLGPLNEEESTQLLDLLLESPSDPGPTLRRAILQTAQGNPMVLALLVGDWQRRGDDCMALSVSAMTATTQFPAKEAFRRVVDGTLAALDPEARLVVEMAAILGQRLNDLTLYTLLDLSVSRTMLAMTRLTTHRILRDAGSHLEFANELIRSQCYHAMPAPPRRMLHGLVADHLLRQEAADEPIPGLEVAWHLVRADRLNEAIPYLLAGGRESIRKGAPHEADLALTTGLPALVGPARRTAILLLAEARQELGRWLESLEVLDAAQDPFDESEECNREVMRIVARRWLGFLSPIALDDATEELLGIAMREIDIEVRVKALAAIIRLLMLTREPAHFDAVEVVIPKVASWPMDDYQMLHLMLARGWILGARRQIRSALEEIEAAVAIAENAGIASSIAVRLLLGKGNLLCLLGKYDDALAPLSKAEIIAKRLDNRTLRAECATQLALVAGRLGSSSDQITWGNLALDLFPEGEWSAGAIGAAYELGIGLAAESRYKEAQSVLDRRTAKRPKAIPAWAMQGDLLCEADVLYLIGQDKRAYFQASKATSQDLASLKNVAYAGIYARWVALLGIKRKAPAEALARLTVEFPDPSTLDLKDEAELLGAIALLESTLSGKPSARWNQMQDRLFGLPSGITTVMRRLGTHPRSDKQKWGLY